MGIREMLRYLRLEMEHLMTLPITREAEEGIVRAFRYGSTKGEFAIWCCCAYFLTRKQIHLEQDIPLGEGAFCLPDVHVCRE